MGRPPRRIDILTEMRSGPKRASLGASNEQATKVAEVVRRAHHLDLESDDATFVAGVLMTDARVAVVGRATLPELPAYEG